MSDDVVRYDDLTTYALAVPLTPEEWEWIFPKDAFGNDNSEGMGLRARSIVLAGLGQFGGPHYKEALRRCGLLHEDEEGEDVKPDDGEDIFVRISRLCARDITRFADLVPLEIETLLRSYMEAE